MNNISTSPIRKRYNLYIDMKRICCILLILPVVLLTLLSCDDDSSSAISYSGEGSITFSIGGARIDHDNTLELIVYDQHNAVQKSFSWLRDDIPEQIDAISAGPIKKIVAFIKDGNGLISQRGESNNFNLNGEQTVDLTIRVKTFTPKRLAPANESVLNGGGVVSFEWEAVEGANNYSIRIYKNNVLVLSDIVSTTEYQISNFCDLLVHGGNELNLTGGYCPFPDTGQTESYTDAAGIEPFGQDSDYSTCQPDFTIFTANGSLFPVNYWRENAPMQCALQLSSISPVGESVSRDSEFFLIWGIAKDNNTGLVWEVKTIDDDSVHDINNYYSWNEAQNHIAQLNSKNFGGISSWRLPTIQELLTIVNSGEIKPAADKTIFYNCRSTMFWTSTCDAKNPNHNWVIDFENGMTYTRLINELYTEDSIDHLNVRAVAGTFPIIEHLEDRFTDNNDGTITDNSTGLMWQKDTAVAETWTNALNYCENLNLNNYNDWRLPDKNQLLSIVDYSSTSESYLPNTEPTEYWTSTTYLGNRFLNAWAVDFSTGKLVSTPKTPHYSETHYVRAVREDK
jgi:Protein of unknown function (DUF1566)